ncbi:MAG: protein kinase [Myxococcota bacterium]|nr:protein kinase [Myxococcota bacterium]
MRTLAAGGMGAVHEAIDRTIGRRLALKTIHPHLVGETELCERFRREALAAGALAHPHIAQVSDYGVDATRGPFLALELLVGESLADRLAREGAMPVAQAVFVTVQILDALGAAHEAGIVHRDIKPGNVFLTQLAGIADVVKVIDFGIAKLYESRAWQRLTATGQAIGTPTYMAPEQALGHPIDHRVDLYAAGLVLYAMLVGRPAFRPGGANALLSVLAGRFTPIEVLAPHVPPSLVEVVTRAVAVDREARFETAAEMRNALVPWLASQVHAVAPAVERGGPPPFEGSTSVVTMRATPAPEVTAPVPARLAMPRPVTRDIRGTALAVAFLAVTLAAAFAAYRATVEETPLVVAVAEEKVPSPLASPAVLPLPPPTLNDAANATPPSADTKPPHAADPERDGRPGRPGEPVALRSDEPPPPDGPSAVDRGAPRPEADTWAADGADVSLPRRAMPTTTSRTVRWREPRIVGALDASGVHAMLETRLDALQRCRTDRDEVAHVTLMFGRGRVNLARPNPNVAGSETEGARCVANVLRGQPSVAGDHGIVMVEVELAARNHL